MTGIASNNSERNFFSKVRSQSDPELILKEACNNLRVNNDDDYTCTTTAESKASSLYEFNNGMLMVDTLSDKYRTFAIDMSRKLQKEYMCATAADMGLTELAAMSFCRILDLQERMQDIYTREEIQSHRHNECGVAKEPFYSYRSSDTPCKRTKLFTELLSFMSKDLDRAHRQYYSALYSLRTITQPKMEVNIHTTTAVVGNNQVVQTNNDA